MTGSPLSLTWVGGSGGLGGKFPKGGLAGQTTIEDGQAECTTLNIWSKICCSNFSQHRQFQRRKLFKKKRKKGRKMWTLGQLSLFKLRSLFQPKIGDSCPLEARNQFHSRLGDLEKPRGGSGLCTGDNFDQLGHGPGQRVIMHAVAFLSRRETDTNRYFLKKPKHIFALYFICSQ